MIRIRKIIPAVLGIVLAASLVFAGCGESGEKAASAAASSSAESSAPASGKDEQKSSASSSSEDKAEDKKTSSEHASSSSEKEDQKSTSSSSSEDQAGDVSVCKVTINDDSLAEVRIGGERVYAGDTVEPGKSEVSFKRLKTDVRIVVKLGKKTAGTFELTEKKPEVSAGKLALGTDGISITIRKLEKKDETSSSSEDDKKDDTKEDSSSSSSEDEKKDDDKATPTPKPGDDSPTATPAPSTPAPTQPPATPAPTQAPATPEPTSPPPAVYTLTITDGAAAANRPGEAYNTLHVYDPTLGWDAPELFSGMPITQGQQLCIFEYPFASNTHMTIKHAGVTIFDGDIAMLDGNEPDPQIRDKNLIKINLIVAGDVTVTTQVIP